MNNKFYTDNFYENFLNMLGVSEEWQNRFRNNKYNFYTKNGYKHINYFIEKFKIKSIIDYGCGFGNGTKDLKNIEVFKYDPYIEEYKEYPSNPADMIVCYNSLNDIEDQYFDAVIDSLYKLTNKILLCNIILNGIHFRTEEWYEEKFLKHFIILDSHVKHFTKEETDNLSNIICMYILLYRKK